MNDLFSTPMAVSIGPDGRSVSARAHTDRKMMLPALAVTAEKGAATNCRSKCDPSQSVPPCPIETV